MPFPSFPVFVREVHELIPIIFSQFVFSAAQVIADVAGVERGLGRWHEGFLDAAFAEEGVNRGGVDGGEEFAFGVGPGVERGAGDVEQAWRDQRE